MNELFFRCQNLELHNKCNSVNYKQQQWRDQLGHIAENECVVNEILARNVEYVV